MPPQVELLWWEGCPSWQRALDMVRDEMARVGLAADAIDVIEITSEADAAGRVFPGSPTIRLDGEDIQPPGPDVPGGLTCRVYRRRDGSVSPLPDREDLREALQRAVREEAVG
jgi:hypothetical protein